MAKAKVKKTKKTEVMKLAEFIGECKKEIMAQRDIMIESNSVIEETWKKLDKLNKELLVLKVDQNIARLKEAEEVKLKAIAKAAKKK